RAEQEEGGVVRQVPGYALLQRWCGHDEPLAPGLHLVAPEVEVLPGELALLRLGLPALGDLLLAVLLPERQLLLVELLGLLELGGGHRLGAGPCPPQHEEGRGEHPDHGEDDELPREQPAPLDPQQPRHRASPPPARAPAWRPAGTWSRPSPAVRSRKTRSRSRRSGVSSWT